MADLEIAYIDSYIVPGTTNIMAIDIVYKNNTLNYIKVSQEYRCEGISEYLLPNVACISPFALSGYHLYRSDRSWGDLQLCSTTMPLTTRKCGTGELCPNISGACVITDILATGTIPIPRSVTKIPIASEVLTKATGIQTKIFDIYISDVTTHKPLKDVNIKFEGPTNIRQGITDINGYLKLSLDYGINIVTITKTGYVKYTDVIDISTDRILRIDITKIRYSCMGDTCGEDPSGAYETIEECLAKSSCSKAELPDIIERPPETGTGGILILGLGIGILYFMIKSKKSI